VPLLEPIESLRYLLAIAMVLIAFTLGMIYFGRSSRAGIEAIGRNPLAKKVIQLTVFMNIILTVVIVLVGLGIAYLILVL
jgi:F0F1-type ATP synthase membrane subunit c/vacuolar-type H+-ATPase subunit K